MGQMNNFKKDTAFFAAAILRMSLKLDIWQTVEKYSTQYKRGNSVGVDIKKKGVRKPLEFKNFRK